MHCVVCNSDNHHTTSHELLEKCYLEELDLDYCRIRSSSVLEEPLPVALSIQGDVLRLELGELPDAALEALRDAHELGRLHVSVGPIS